MPNQIGILKSPSQLRRDEGVSDTLKDICLSLGKSVRNGLLAKGIINVKGAANLCFLKYAIEQAVPNELTEHEVLLDLLEHLDRELPDGSKPLANDGESLLNGTIRLLDFIGSTKRDDSASLAKKVPLVTEEGKTTKSTSEKLLMAPSATWHVESQPFKEVYPPSRILATDYAGNGTEQMPSVVAHLVKWKIAIPDPLHVEAPAELKDEGLAAICQVPAESTDVAVGGVEFSQIALLRSAIFNRVETTEDAARLLGLVLCYIAPRDERWRTFRSIKGRKSGQDVELHVRDALWLADLRSCQWIPRKERGKTTRVAADAQTLEPLLDSHWLNGNKSAIQLLTECFGFDALELLLLGVAPGNRKQFRDGLARFLETAGFDLNTYESMRQGVLAKAQRERDVKRCRRIGLAIQDAITAALIARGLHIEVKDRGLDLKVWGADATDIEDFSTCLEIDAEFVEIKSTQTGNACMTPTQAETAASEAHRYSLCVVDLRSVPNERLDNDWSSADIEPLAKIVVDIGATISTTCELVERARTQPVAIRNDNVLRYNVTPSVWGTGVSIDTWISEKFG